MKAFNSTSSNQGPLRVQESDKNHHHPHYITTSLPPQSFTRQPNHHLESDDRIKPNDKRSENGSKKALNSNTTLCTPTNAKGKSNAFSIITSSASNSCFPSSSTSIATTTTTASKPVLNPATRNPRCAHCRNHGVQTTLKGHKAYCPYRHCNCAQCQLVRMRQKVMAKNVALRRRQELDRQKLQEAMQTRQADCEEANNFREFSPCYQEAPILTLEMDKTRPVGGTPRGASKGETKDHISTLALIILNFYNNDPKIAIDSVRKVATELDTLLQKEPLVKSTFNQCFQKEEMEVCSNKISPDVADNGSLSSSSFYNESPNKIANQPQSHLPSDTKIHDMEDNRYRPESNLYLPIVGTWALRNFQAFNATNRTSQEANNPVESNQNQVNLDKVKNEVDEEKDAKEGSRTPENDISNSPYSIKNLTSHLPKKPKLSPAAFKPTPKYNDYTYITNSNFFRKYLSTQLGHSHKYYEPRAHNFPGFYFPTYPTNYFHSNWHKTPFRIPTPTK